MTSGHKWAVVLAGGEGRRLQALSRVLAGDDRPKQFCRVFGDRTLLEDTLGRLGASVPRRSTLAVVLRAHAPYYAPDLRDFASWQVVEQPVNRGTGAAVALALTRVDRLDPGAVVGFFPADHHFTNEPALNRAVAHAYATAARHVDRLVLVGAEPTGPETDYGWIETGDPLMPLRRPLPADGARTVAAFWEKPGATDAERLFAQGGLWNTFIVVGTRRAFDRVFSETVPHAWAEFSRLEDGGGLDDRQRIDDVYARVAPFDLSHDVLQRVPEALAVVPAPGAGWTDLGRPARVLDVLRAGNRTHPRLPRLAG